MTNVFDVASYILKKQGEMTTLKLQKLVYYCQAWSLVWDEKPVYDEEIQAWANGPVEPDLFYKHQGQYKIADIPGGNADNVKGDSRDTVEMTLRRYGDKPAYWLVRLSHSETTVDRGVVRLPPFTARENSDKPCFNGRIL